MNLNLQHKNALVCGSTQGIGKAAAMELANQTAVSERCSKDAEASKLAQSKRNAAIVKGVAKYNCIMDEVTLLEEKIRKVHNWAEVSDLEIGRYMHDIKDWNVDIVRDSLT